MENITIFNFFKKKPVEKEKTFLFFIIFSPFFRKKLENLEEIYNRIDNEDERSLFLIRQDSFLEFAVIRAFILFKKYYGKKVFLEFYKDLLEAVYFLRDFMVNNSVNEERITKDFVERLKRQKNYELFLSSNFKAENVLYSKIEKETQLLEEKFKSLEAEVLKQEEKEEKKDEKEKETVTERDKKKEAERNDEKDGKQKENREKYEIKNGEIIVYDKNGKILKRVEAYFTKIKKRKPFIPFFIKKDGYYYYLGKYPFGENIKIDLKDENIKEAVEDLVKEIRKNS